MGHVNKILLGTGAALVSVAAAQAADLPVAKAAPVEYVRICDAYGAGFFFIPGTDTCLRITGRLRADYTAIATDDIYSGLGTNNTRATTAYSLNTSTGVITSRVTPGLPGNRSPVVLLDADAENLTGWEARARIGFDARTNTPWGVVQAVGQLRMTRSTGVVALSGVLEAGSTAAGVTLEAAYIRFAGFTFGAARDNFANMPSVMYLSGGYYASFANGAKQLAYTFTAGGGLSATIAIQDYADTAGGSQGIRVLPNSSFGLFARDQYLVSPGTVRHVYDAVPQFNARLDWQQGWGALGLAAAWANPAVNNILDTYDESQSVWAVGGTVTFRLPMLASGSRIDFTAAYADGMTQYTTNWISFKGSTASRDANGFVLAPTSIVLGPNGPETVKSWSIATIFQHYWTPQWRTALAASYGQIDAPNLAKACNWNGTSCFGDATVANFGAQLAWLPTRDFEIGVELSYTRVSQDVRGYVAGFNTTGANAIVGVVDRTDEGFMGRLRVERNF